MIQRKIDIAKAMYDAGSGRVSGALMKRLIEGLFAAIVVCYGCVSDAPGPVQFLRLDSADMAWVDQKRPLVSADEPMDLEMIAQLSLPESVADFSLSAPVAVAARGERACRIGVGDAGDDAIHVFDLDGHYLHSIYGGAADTSRTEGIRSIAVTADGGVIVAALAWATIARYSPDGTEVGYETLDGLVDGISFGSDIAVDDKGRIYEHWLGLPLAAFDIHWRDGLPLVRAASGAFGPVREWGELRVGPQGRFTIMMNEGRVVVWRDTLWFGRKMDGRILGFSAAQRAAVHVVEPPVFFHAQSPVELKTSNGGPGGSASQYHLRDFAISPSGLLFIVQSTSFPDVPGTMAELNAFNAKGGLWRPQQVVSVVDRESRLVGVLRVPEEIREIAVTENRIILRLRDLTREKRMVRLYENPYTDSVQENPSLCGQTS